VFLAFCSYYHRCCFYHILFGNDTKRDVGVIKNEVESGRYDYERGAEAMNKENYEMAGKYFLDTLKYKDQLSEGNYINTLNNLGTCYAEQGKLSQAENYWKQSAKLGYTTALNNLKILNRQLNK
jgi:tetratricopeptide (TPR) repeat protein